MVQRIRRKPRDAPFNTAGQHFESWQARALDAVSLWMEARGDWRPNGDRPLRVADFGAGNERLRDVLSDRLGHSFSYFPYDLHPQRPTSVKLNLLEETPPESYDLVFALGLLEYLPPENDFLTRLRSRCRFALVSFVFVTAFAPETRWRPLEAIRVYWENGGRWPPEAETAARVDDVRQREGATT